MPLDMACNNKQARQQHSPSGSALSTSEQLYVRTNKMLPHFLQPTTTISVA